MQSVISRIFLAVLLVVSPLATAGDRIHGTLENLAIPGYSDPDAVGGKILVTSVPSSGATEVISFPESGNISYDVTLTANCTFTVTGGTEGELQTITLILRQDGTAGRVATLPAVIKWPNGVAPILNTAAGRIDVLKISTPDAGVTLFGSY